MVLMFGTTRASTTSDKFTNRNKIHNVRMTIAIPPTCERTDTDRDNGGCQAAAHRAAGTG